MLLMLLAVALVDGVYLPHRLSASAPG